MLCGHDFVSVTLALDFRVSYTVLWSIESLDLIMLSPIKDNSFITYDSYKP